MTRGKGSSHTEEFDGFVGSNFELNMTKFARHEAPKSVAWCKLTFDGRALLNREGLGVGV